MNNDNLRMARICDVMVQTPSPPHRVEILSKASQNVLFLSLLLEKICTGTTLHREGKKIETIVGGG